MDRMIALIAGESGSGKSFFVANLINALIFDTDVGGGLSYADARIKRNGSERVEVATYKDVLDELKARNAKGKLKKVQTLVIDHMSSLHQESSITHNPNYERDYGRAGEIATREWRKIRDFVRHQDFNLIVTAHLKAKWENDQAVGLKADGAKNIEGDMSVVLQLRRTDKYPANAFVQKWRRDPEDERGAVPTVFPFTMEQFIKIAGVDMNAPRQPVAVATEEQVKQLTGLLEVVKLPDDQVAKWLKKAGVDSFAEMPGDNIQKCIDHVNKLVTEAKGVAA